MVDLMIYTLLRFIYIIKIKPFRYMRSVEFANNVCINNENIFELFDSSIERCLNFQTLYEHFIRKFRTLEL